MWVAFLKIFQLLQKLMPQRIHYDSQKGRFIENNKFSKRYWYMNWQVVQAWSVATFRMLHYLRSEPGKSGITFVDFVLDLLLWAITFLQSCCCWSFYRKRHCICFALNQYMAKRNSKGKNFYQIL